MIERLELRGWRSFDHVAIDFGPGTTFVVAPNGVGKTSLLLGLSWALFGDDAGVDVNACVRLGHDNAQATVRLRVGEIRSLTIQRTITASGKSTVQYTDGETPIDEADALAQLAEEFGAPIEIAARLAVIRGSGKDTGELQLDEHLYDVFGVSGLRRAAALTSRLHREAVSARKKLRVAARSQLNDHDQLEALAKKLLRDLDELAPQREHLAEAVTIALQAKQALAMWDAHDAALEARAAAIDELLGAGTRLGLEGHNLDGLAHSLSAAREANEASSEQAQRTLIEAHAQALAARAALDLLESHDPSCPTCARPFHGDELVRAVEAQRNSLAFAQDRTAHIETELDRFADSQRALNEVLTQANALSRSVIEPPTPRPTVDPDAAVATAQEDLRKHDQLAGGVATERNRIVTQLDNDDELQAAFVAEKAAWQREALTQATAASLTRIAERLATEHIEPLSQQVRWRWKALFGEDGLQLRPDGTIARVVGERELPWSQLSSGEQIWARLVASLLVARTSSTLPFAWLDEPLEHLDPRARRIVATDLATSTQSGRPGQMIVTTYEYTLARQLAEDLPNTHLRQINRAQAYEPTRRQPAPHTNR